MFYYFYILPNYYSIAGFSEIVLRVIKNPFYIDPRGTSLIIPDHQVDLGPEARYCNL
jgi:hypothetical protein